MSQFRVVLRRVAAGGGGDGASARAHRRSHAAQGHQRVRMPVVRSVGRVKVMVMMTLVITHGRIGVIVWRQRARVTEDGLQVSGDVRRRAGLVTPGAGVDELSLPVNRLRLHLQAVRVGEVKSRR